MNILTEVTRLLGQLDVGGMIAMFWHAILFEFPRFLIATFAIAGLEVTNGLRARGRHRKSSPTKAQDLSISILLPGHNEGASLTKCIRGLHEQVGPPCQIIVIDDGSSDDMAAQGRRLKREGLIDVFLSTGIRGGKSAAANLGLAYCTGDIVVIGDIDTSFDRNAISEIARPFVDPRIGAVCGNLGVRNVSATMITRFQAIQYLISISVGRRVSDMLGVLFIASGAFAAFRRDALTTVGGWEIGPGEDADLTVKIRRAGWRVAFQPTAWALTDVPETLPALARQRLRWNRSLVRVRGRKFRDIYNPLAANFRLSDTLGHLDIIYFQAVLPVSFMVYVIWLFANYGATGGIILLASTAFYIVISLISFAIASALSGHHGRPGLILFVPGYAVFNAFVLRIIGVYAYLDELLMRSSYKDNYVPRRVLKQADKF